MVDSSTENPKMELHDDDFGLLKQTQNRFELVDLRNQNTVSKITHGCKFSYTILAKKNLGVRKIPVKRRYHRARIKKPWGDGVVFQTKYTPQRDLVQALKNYGMFRSSSIGACLVNRMAERVHLKGKRLMMIKQIHKV